MPESFRSADGTDRRQAASVSLIERVQQTGRLAASDLADDEAV